MKLLTKVWQHRRDFEGIYICEGCDEREKIRGYDDRNFHDNVTPYIKCKKCEKSSTDLGIKIQHVETMYPEGYQV